MPRYEMKDLLDLVLSEGASDLHLPCFSPPVLRIHGQMQPLDGEQMDGDDTEYLMKSITSEANQEKLHTDGTVDFGFQYGDKARFRVSAFRAKGHIGMVLRTISNDLLGLDVIGLPPMIKDVLFRPRGLVLVTGPTGSGKSTTLASMIDVINREKADHIITIEDPIEFYHTHKKSVVTQREVHNDVPSFAEAIRRALRQDPDTILVGEMRDLETIGAAITAAETGHLVFGTLHTTGAAETVDRIIDSFPTTQQQQVRTQLAASLVCVISQVLLKRIDKKGRVAAFEIMVMTPSIAASIREGKTYRITSDIQTGAKYGMRTLDVSLMELFFAGKISYQDVVTKAKDPDATVARIQEELKARKG